MSKNSSFNDNYSPIILIFSSCCFLINTPDSEDDRKINEKVISFNDFAVCLVVPLCLC